MPSVSSILKGLAALAPLVAAVPANYARTNTPARAMEMPPKPSTITETAGSAMPPAAQAAAAAPAAAAGKLTDVDILNL